MPRTKIPDSLIHNPKEVEQNAIHFDHLCEAFQSVFQPVIEVSVRDSSKQRLQTNDESDNDFKEEFAGALRSEVSFITGYWINVLDGTYRANQPGLTKYLLPQNSVYSHLFFQYLEDNHGISGAETSRLMKELREKLFENVSEILLPVQLRIVKELKAFRLDIRVI